MPLPWQYPVCELATGQLKYDNFGGRWGDQEQLDRFMQAYAVEKARARSPEEGSHRYRDPATRRLDQVVDQHHRRGRMKIIEILVNSKGETTVATSGFAGHSCRDASKFIEQALGQRIGEQLTAEFHQVSDGEQHQQQV